MKEDRKADAIDQPIADEQPIQAETTETEPTSAGELGESMAAQLAEQSEQIALLEQQLLRLQADFDNYRKRVLREREEQNTQVEAALLKEMLPVIDNFDRALAALPEEQSWADGVRLVQRQWIDVLTAKGLESIDCGQPFDPALHNAVMRDESGEQPDGTILQELQRGYLYKGKLLRPSMVKVAANS